MRIVLYATAREAVGRSVVIRPIRPGQDRVDAILGALSRDFPALSSVLPSCRFARNGKYVQRTSIRLSPGDELAVHPPYSGG
ncbi:MAG: MoaD/ThiS family protein [Thermoplasmata archaeon]|nr:MoaD/ThiS family protein [Thermoplasmata archaeon]